MTLPVFRRPLGAAGALLALALLASAGCSGPSELDSTDAGRTAAYTPGVPNFDLEAFATFREGRPGVSVYLGIPYASLIFLRSGELYRAGYEFTVKVGDRNGRNQLSEQVWSDTVSVPDYEATQQYHSTILDRHLDLEPGEYLLEVTLRDQNSDKSATRQQRVTVPEIGGRAAFLSPVHMEARREGRPFEPVLSLHLPSDLDSMRAVVELRNPAARADVRMTLLKLESDLSVAMPPYWLTPMMGSLAYRGVDYSRSKSDTLQVTRRTVEGAGDQVTIEFALPDLPVGIYRMDVEATVPGGEVVLRERRDLSIKGPEFPRVTTLDQLVEALTYIAREREIERIREAPTVEEKRKRFDAFWGELVGNRQVAINLLKTYYSRVEEANLFFTTHKEGWKTDRGMVYIVLGAPIYVENLFDAEVWHYTYSDRDPLNTFVFEKVKPLGAESSFDNYLLARRPFYERAWSRAVDRWRSGTVL